MGADFPVIFKAYDVRGIYPDQLDEDASFRIGRAFASWSGAERLVLGRDCRASSPALAAAFADGVTGAGVGVIDIGLATTDMVYFASGRLNLPGAMFTASHNPAAYNGVKLCREAAAPVGEETGLADVRSMAEGPTPPAVPTVGSVEERSFQEAYIDHVLTFADLERFAPLTVAADAANGMAGLVVPSLFERLPATLVPLYMELDGTFPNHPADPIDPKNLVDLQAAVKEQGADIGLAFDGDADRSIFSDENGRILDGGAVALPGPIKDYGYCFGGNGANNPLPLDSRPPFSPGGH
jgi:phosphomannomutase